MAISIEGLAKFYLELTNNKDILLSMYTKYADLADICTHKKGEIELLGNKETFRVLTNEKVIKFARFFRDICPEYRVVKANNPNIENLFNSYQSMTEYVSKYRPIVGGGSNDEVSFENFKLALDMYNVQTISELSDKELVEIDTHTNPEDISIDFDDDFEIDEDITEEFSAEELLGEEAQESSIDNGTDESDEVIIEDLDAEAMQVDKMVVDSIVGSILNVYDKMYQPLFESKPVGILTPSGIVGINKDNDFLLIQNGKAFAISLFNTLKKASKDTLVSMDYHTEMSFDCLNPDGSLKYNYCPNFHIKNAFGLCENKDGTRKRVKSWGTFRGILQKTISNTIIKIMDKHKFEGEYLIRAKKSLVDIFTTCIIASQFDITKSMLLCIKSESLRQTIGYEKLGNLIFKGEIFGDSESMMQLVNNSTEEFGIHKILIVFDKARYNGELMFAYKAIRDVISGGGQIDAKNTLIGRDAKGGHVKFNFESPQTIVGAILAGSGSGKGVVTLSLLATFIASGMPVVYADWKPDMSAMLWNLERKTGARILSIDGASGKNENGVTPVRQYQIGYGMDTYIPEISERLNVVPYIKMMMLMAAVALARQVNYGGLSAKDKKAMFILDEAEGMNKDLCLLRPAIDKYISANKPKKGEEETAEFKYVNTLRQMIESLNVSNSDFSTRSGRIGNVGCIIIGQHSDVTAWATGAIKRDPIGYLVGNCSMKMLGKDACDTNKYSLGDADITGKELLNSMGYFAVVPNALANKNNQSKIQVAKTYLVLNENDYSPNEAQCGPATKGLLKNIQSEEVAEMTLRDIYPNGQPNPLVGFPGLIEYMSQEIGGMDAKANLESGYILVERLLTSLGILGQGSKYRDIEGWLFDASQESLYSYGQLKKAIEKGTTIFEVTGEGTIENMLDTEDSNNESVRMLFDEDGDDEILDFGLPDSQIPEYGEDTEYSMPISNSTQNIQTNVNSGIRHEKITPEEARIFRQKAERFKEENQKLDIDVGINNITDGERDKFLSLMGKLTNEEKEVLSRFSVMPTIEPTCTTSGKTGRVINIEPSDINIPLALNEDNSIVVEIDPSLYIEKKCDKLFRYMKGINYDLNKRGSILLDKVASQINPRLVTRVTINGDEIYFQNRLVHSSNLIGGIDDIRLTDILNFKTLFKRFPVIKTLTIDEDTLRNFRMQIPNIPDDIYKYGKNLVEFIIISRNERIVFNKNDMMAEEKKRKLMEKVAEADYRNKIAGVCASRNTKSFNELSPAENKRFYNYMKDLSSAGFGHAANRIKQKNPGVIRATLWGAFGLGTIALGGLGYGISRMFNGLRRR